MIKLISSLFFTLIFFGFGTFAEAQNTMHPVFTFLDSTGKPTKFNPSFEQTCNGCHNVQVIHQQNTHFTKTTKIACTQCHLPTEYAQNINKYIDSNFKSKKELVESLSRPQVENCLQCHSQANSGMDPVRIVPLANDTKEEKNIKELLSLTQGSFYSDQKVSSSALNIKDKYLSNRPWDVHGQRKINCTSCHFSENNPAKNTFVSSTEEHLKFDIRKESDFANYLKEPSHHLQTASCIQCHNVIEKHKSFPYEKKHLEKVSCEACHIPNVAGPILKYLDVPAKLSGFDFWNVSFNKGQDEITKLNTKITSPWSPFLLEQDGKIYPFNIVKTGTAHKFIKISHGILPAQFAIKNCQECHGVNSRIVAGSTSNQGWASELGENNLSIPQIESYVIGSSRNKVIDGFGIFTFVLVFAVILVHIYFRLKTRKYRRKEISENTVLVTLYGRYERFWHWTLALTTSVLLITGIDIHYAGVFNLFDFQFSAKLHNAAALIFFANSFMSLFYYITTTKFKQFMPERYELWVNILHQFKYYTYGIFLGEKHPPKSPQKKMNPLQQITYLALLNVLLPLQIITGILMWGVDKFDIIAKIVKGYDFIAPIHTAGSWMFLSFLILHIYLTTTGTKVFTNIKAMLTGEERLDVSTDFQGSHHEKK